MKSRLFCQHCEKYYEVEIDQIRLMKNFKDEKMSFAHNTYFYKDKNACFFKTLHQIRKGEIQLRKKL